MKTPALKAIYEKIHEMQVCNITTHFKSGTTKTYKNADFDFDFSNGIVVIRTETETEFVETDSIERISI